MLNAKVVSATAMYDIVEELSNLFKHSRLPMPDVIAEVDRMLAKEMGIDLDTEEPCDKQSRS